MSKRVLITGVTGFFGVHFLEYILNKTDWTIIGIENLIPKPDLYFDALRRRDDFKKRVDLHCYDLSLPISTGFENRIMERSFLSDGANSDRKIDYIFNLASDTNVEQSARYPTTCLKANFNIALHLLDFAKRIKPDIFFQLSSDEVYGEVTTAGKGHLEWDRLLPNTPYGASKAIQEVLAISYWKSYDVPVVIVNTANIIGERQNTNKFIPKLIEAIANNKTVHVFGESENQIGSRAYIHAQNLADALVWLTQRQPGRYSNNQTPDKYHVGGDVELNNLELAKLVANLMKKSFKYKLVKPDSKRKGYDKRFALDSRYVRSLGWEPPTTFRNSLSAIIDYTLKHPHWN